MQATKMRSDRLVDDLMTRNAVTVSSDDTIHAAAGLLAEHEISGAPVVDDGKLVGIVTEADLIRGAFPPARIDRPGSFKHVFQILFRGRRALFVEDASVASIMTNHVVTVGPKTTISEAAATMDGTGVKRLPVVDDKGHLIGIISRADLMASIGRSDEELRYAVLAAIRLAGEETVEDVEVDVHEGTATLRGTADRRTTKDIALKLAADVPGVLDVVDRLDYKIDDTLDLPRQKDPWAIGALVKHVQ